MAKITSARRYRYHPKCIPGITPALIRLNWGGRFSFWASLYKFYILFDVTLNNWTGDA